MADPSAPRYLIVIRRDRPEVYTTLQPLAEGYVTFVRDQRREERRTEIAPVTVERRTRDRRCDPPLTWTVLGFVLVRQPEISA
jgi:hypothetical protein